MCNIIKSEWVKLSSYPICMVGIICAIFAAPVALLSVFFNNTESVEWGVKTFFIQGLNVLRFGQVGILLMVAGFWGQEYEGHTFRTTLLAIPSRIKCFCAKWLLTTILVILCGVLSMLLISITAIALYDFHQISPLATGFFAKMSIALISWVQLAWICSGISVVVQSKIVTIGITILPLLGFSQLLFMVSTLAKYLPDMAGMNLFFYLEQTSFLEKFDGIVVQFLWTVIMTLIAICFHQKRNVR